MAALDELNVQCEKRGWRLAMTGTAHFSDGTPGPNSCPALIVDGLEVRGVKIAGSRELLARVPIEPFTDIDLDKVAVDLAHALESQGLIT